MAGSTAQDGISSRLASFVADTEYARIPQTGIERVRKSVLDVLGCGIYGSRFETAAALREFARRRAEVGGSSIWCGGGKASASLAAFVNGSFVQATELAEGFSRGAVHPGNGVIPGLLAVAEQDDASGKDFLAAATIGYELLIRLGITVPQQFLTQQGFYKPAVFGAIGTAAAVSRLKGWDAAKTSDALSVAAVLAPTPLLAGSDEGAAIKDTYQGISSKLGVEATELVAAGIGGIHDWVEPWFRAIPREYDLAPMTERLGDYWYVPSGGLHVKVKPLMAMSQAVVAALGHVLADNTVDPNDVVEIVAESSRRILLSNIPRPANLGSARASIPFLLAAVLCRQQDFRDDPYMIRFLRPELLGDRAIEALSKKVVLKVDEGFDYNMESAPPGEDVNGFIKLEGRVTLTLRDGRSLVGYDDVFASTGNMSWEHVGDKFRAVSSDVISPARANEIIEATRSLGDGTSVRRLVALVA